MNILFEDNFEVLLEDELDELNTSIEGEETEEDNGNEGENTEETEGEETSETDSEDNPEGEEETTSEGETDENNPEGEETSETEEETDEQDANMEEGLSEEEKEAKIKRPYYYESFSEVLNTSKNFLDKITDISSNVSDEVAKYLLKKISNSLFKQKNDIQVILREKILNMSIENLNNLLTMFITKTDTLIDLTNDIFDKINNNK